MLLAAGLLEMGALVAMARVPALRATPTPALLLWIVAWGGHLWALRSAARGQGPSTRAVVWAVGIAGRLALLPLLPHFSEDLWRYLWDGHVAVQGVNPYAHAPADPALDPLATGWRGLVNHPGVPTIYPPGAQAVFALLALVGPTVVAYKAAWIAADLGVAALVDRLASERGDGSPIALLLWLWSPLVLVEVAWSGHLEPLGVLPMMAALLVLARGGDGRLAGGLLGLGAAVKFAPLAALPALARRHRVRAAVAGLLAFALLYLPYAGAGAELFAGLGEYAARWRFNAALFPLLELALGDAARPVAAGLVAAIAVGAAARGWSVSRTLFWTVGAALLLSPTIHPWYALWILPLAAVRRSWPWVLWTALLFLAYAGRDAYLATGTWPHPPALAALVHGPLLLLLALGALRRRGLLPGTDGGVLPGADGGGVLPGSGRRGAQEAEGEQRVEGGSGR